MTHPKPPGERTSRGQYRGHTVPVTLTDDEHAVLVAAKARSGKSMASLLREAFLTRDAMERALDAVAAETESRRTDA